MPNPTIFAGMNRVILIRDDNDDGEHLNAEEAISLMLSGQPVNVIIEYHAPVPLAIAAGIAFARGSDIRIADDIDMRKRVSDANRDLLNREGRVNSRKAIASVVRQMLQEEEANSQPRPGRFPRLNYPGSLALQEFVAAEKRARDTRGTPGKPLQTQQEG